MKIFTTSQIVEIDRYTIENEPIAGIDLMERAASRIAGWLADRFTRERQMVFFAGPGNNGGDALAVARQLAGSGYRCEIIIPDFGKEPSASFLINLERLVNQSLIKITSISDGHHIPKIFAESVIVDGLFGSGLTRPLSGFPASVVDQINQLGNIVVSIDIPSGMMGEDNSGNNPDGIVRADFTLTLQFPKIAFFFPENEKYTGRWTVLPIGLHPEGISITDSPFWFVDLDEVRNLLPARGKFAHKGDFGHAMLVAGSYGKMGAAVLAAKACLRSGAGLLTAHVPGKGYGIIQAAVPEAMASIDSDNKVFSEFPDPGLYSAVGAGPGLGQSPETCRALENLLGNCKAPMVIDADALNIIAANRELLRKIPFNSVLTPHPGEFRRLAGDCSNSWERLLKQAEFSKRYRIILVLKGAYTSVTLPDGRIFFNSTGNPGMATAGSGDVLTGIILGLLSQRIDPENAALFGVYLHGLAGDIAAAKNSEPGLVAGDIIGCIGKAFLRIIP